MISFEISDLDRLKAFNVLYVEDNKDVRDASYSIFEKIFATVDTAVDGQSGLDIYMAKETDFYDLVISDIEMPNMNGIDMAKAILEINKNQNILMITAFNEDEYIQQLKNLGIVHYIHKPIRLNLLVQTLLSLDVSLQSC